MSHSGVFRNKIHQPIVILSSPLITTGEDSLSLTKKNSIKWTVIWLMEIISK